MNTVLIYSGGLDSTVLLYHLLAEGDTVRCLGVDYGQRHRRELDSAREVAALAGVGFRTADLSALRDLLGGSSQTDDSFAVPEGHYEADSMKLTVVPNRNMLMLSVAAAFAISSKSQRIAYAAHSGDHAIYPDCRGEFVHALAAAVRLCDWSPVELVAPFVKMTKAEIVARGAELGAPVGRTWSCYKGGEKHCGVCGTCTERREAFKIAGVIDPTEYA